jgi:dienelactone hydrolase
MLLSVPVLLSLLAAPTAVAFPQAPALVQPDSTVHVTSDGWLLVGSYARPALPESPWPAVLLLNRADGNRRAYDSTAAVLARHGIASLRLDLRGHGESTNRGRFVPSAPGMDTLLQGTPTDIAAGLNWLAQRPGVDSTRLGVVGASYSGEFAVMAGRSGRPARAYALLSPGSLSSESIRWLDALGTRWLFVASRQERTQATRDVIAEVLDRARWADIWLWEPQSHATRLFDVVPELPTLLTAWLVPRLSRQH